jgi:hypothetical protein
MLRVPRPRIPLLSYLGREYSAKVLGTEAGSLIGYWPLNEDHYCNAPYFDAANDYVSVYSDSLRDAFDGAEGTVSCWLKVADPGTWADGTTRKILILSPDADNYVLLQKKTTAGIDWYYNAGGVHRVVTKGSLSTLGWVHLALTWSKSGNAGKAYWNGVQEGAALTSLGTWAGSLVDGRCLIGSGIAAPTQVWEGSLAHVAIWSTPLSGAQIAAITAARSGQRAQVLATEPGSLLAYWPLDESSGATADNAEGTAARDGAYTSVTLAAASFMEDAADNAEGTAARDGAYLGLLVGQPGIGDGGGAAWFDDIHDYINIYSTSLKDAFDGDEGTVIAWAKVNSAAEWSDGEYRTVVQLRASAENRIHVRKGSDDKMYWRHEGSNVMLDVERTMTELGWCCYALTWSATADEVKGYLNGVQVGSTQTGMGAWSGDLASDDAAIGARNYAATAYWHGWIAHVAIWTKALTPAQIARLAAV